MELFSRFQGSSPVLGQICLLDATLYYAGLLALAWAGYTGRLQTLINRAGAPATSLVRRLASLLAILLLGTTSVFVWRLALSAPDGRLHLTELDTNSDGASGEALLLESPSGRFVLVGGGSSSSSLSDALGRRLPPSNRAWTGWWSPGPRTLNSVPYRAFSNGSRLPTCCGPDHTEQARLPVPWIRFWRKQVCCSAG